MEVPGRGLGSKQEPKGLAVEELDLLAVLRWRTISSWIGQTEEEAGFATVYVTEHASALLLEGDNGVPWADGVLCTVVPNQWADGVLCTVVPNQGGKPVAFCP